MAEVVIYTKSFGCPYCDRAKQLLNREGLVYREIQVDKHPEKLAEMIEKSSGRRTVPQIFIDGKHRGGCDDLYAHYKEHSSLI